MDREHEYMTRGMAESLAEDVIDRASDVQWGHYSHETAMVEVGDVLYELAAAIEEGRLADWWNGR